jgi:hypothetical protein
MRHQNGMCIRIDKLGAKHLINQLKEGLWLPRRRDYTYCYHPGDIKKLILIGAGYQEVAGTVQIERVEKEATGNLLVRVRLLQVSPLFGK